MNKLLLTVCTIAFGIFFGFFLQKWLKKIKKVPDENISAICKNMQKIALFVCIPLSATLSLWGLPTPDVRLLALPFLGLINWALGGCFAILAARWMSLKPAQTGSMFCCGSFTNIGAIGSLVCVFFLGESSIALVALYRLLEEFYYFGVAMPIAQQFGDSGDKKKKLSLLFLFKDPVLLGIIMALMLGILLNIMHIPRPSYCGNIASSLVFVATLLFLTSVGMRLHVSKMKYYTGQCLAVGIIKFCIAPFCIYLLALMLGLGKIDGGLPLKTIFVLSCMPVAMNALVPPSLYNLDIDLANSCWLSTTAGLIVILPLLLWVLPYI